MSIGNRIGAKEKAYYIGVPGDWTLRTAWFPMIQVDGRMVHIQAPTPTGRMEADTLGQAIRLAAEYRDTLRKSGQAGKSPHAPRHRAIEE